MKLLILLSCTVFIFSFYVFFKKETIDREMLNNNSINKIDSTILKKIKEQNIEDEKKGIIIETSSTNIINSESGSLDSKNINTLKEDNTIFKIENISIPKINYSGNISNIINIFGDGIEEIEKVQIGDNIYNAHHLDGKIYLIIGEESLLNGEYNPKFILKDGSEKVFFKKIFFIYSNSEIIISDITPKKIVNDIDRNIVIQGRGFKKTISIQLSNNIVLKDTSFNIINDNVMSIVIPKGLSVGEYSLNIMNTKGIHKSEINIEVVN